MTPLAEMLPSAAITAERDVAAERARATRWPWLVAVLLFLATFALFSRGIGYGFIDYDDPDFVTANAHVRGGLTSGGVRWAFTSGGQAANWQPLSWLSLMLDAQLYGIAAPGFHLTNILLHSLNAVLVFFLLRRLRVSAGWSVWCAAVFVWHPLRVESVAWIAERKDVLSAFFGLTSLLLYVCYRQTPPDRRGRSIAFYLAALVAFALGLLAKAMLVTLPAVMLLIDLWCEREARSDASAVSESGVRSVAWRRRLAEKLPFLILAIGSAAMTYRFQKTGGAVNGQFAWPHLTANAVLSLVRYLEKIGWPENLAVCYPHELTIAPRAFAGAAIVLVAITVALIRWRATRGGALLGWLWFVGMLVPVLGFIPAGGQAMADRYTYLPSLGLLLAFVALVDGLPLVPTRLIATLAAGALLPLAMTTWHQLGFWRDSTTLFEHALAVTPDNYIAYCCRSTTLLNEGQPAAAADAARRALAINSDYAPAYYHLGATQERLGRIDEALMSYRQTVQRWPEFAPAHARLGYVWLHRQAPAEALREFQTAAALQPDDASAWLGQGLALTALHRSAEALRACAAALYCRPDYPEAESALGNLLAAHGHAVEAWAHYEAALRSEPYRAEVHFNYANSLIQQDEPQRAAVHYRAAVRLRANDADFHAGLAAALEALQELEPAAQEYAEAVRLRPDHAEAHYNLGHLLLDRREFAAAESHFRAATTTQPDFGPAYVGLGVTEAQQGRTEAAVRDEMRAVALLPNDATARYFCGEALQSVGRLEEAAAQWEAALRLAPNLPGLGDRLTELKRQLRRP